jgi:hypothetical protein
MTLSGPPKTLLEALLAVQKEIPRLKLTKDSTGQIAGRRDYRYLGLEKLHAAVLPVLSRHGLVWTTYPGADGDGNPVLRYELAHVESEKVAFATMPLVLDKSNMQALGSAITYARRYSLLSVLGAVADEDDDGAKASESPSSKPSVRSSRPPEPVTQAKKPEDKVMNTEELNQIMTACEAAGKDILTAAKAVGKDEPRYLTVADGWEILAKIKAKGPVAA